MTNEKNKNLETKTESLYDFTRKSVVGAVYRVGASFTMDAIYLSLVAAGTYYTKENMESLESITTGFSDFVNSLDAGKLMRVAGFVVGINFLDYKFDITNKLNNLTKQTEKGLSKILGIEKRKGKKIYSELSKTKFYACEGIRYNEEFEIICNDFLPAKLFYVKTSEKNEKIIVDKFKEGMANNYGGLCDFVHKTNLTPEGFLGDETFLDFLYERDTDKKDRIENKFSLILRRKDSEGKLWVNKINCQGDEEIYFIKKI